MASLTTALVGRNTQCLAPGPAVGAAADQVLIINLDTANTVNLGSPSSTNVATPLGPLASITLTAPVYAVAASEPLLVGIAPGGSGYSPGSLNISGPVTAEITGPVTVEGTIDIGNTPTVDLAAGATVDIGGTADVNVQNATIDVIGSGGFVLPGQLSLLVKNSGTLAAGAGSSSQLGGVSYDVSTYSSILFLANSPSTSSTATGAAVCARWLFQWTDSAGNIIEQDSVSCLLGSEFCVQVPVKGSKLNVFLSNPGTTGTISYPAGSVLLWGDYRTVTDITVMSYGISSLPVITGWTLIQPAAPVLSIPRWIASLNQTETASTQYLLPLPLWNGPVSGWFQQITQALASNATLVDLTYAVQGSIPAGTAYSFGTLANLPSAIATALTEVSYYSPPTQLAFLFKASGTSGGQTFLNLTGSA